LYDFWYQPRFNVLVSSEWAAPNTFEGGFQLDDVGAGKYGHRLHLWDLEQHRRTQSIDFGEQGLVPLEIRGFHDVGEDGGMRLDSKFAFHLPEDSGSDGLPLS